MAGLGLFNERQLTTGKLPKGLGFLESIAKILIAMVMGLLVGQGTVALTSRYLPAPVPQILGGVTSFVTGGPVGAAGYAVSSGLIGRSPEAQGSGF